MSDNCEFMSLEQEIVMRDLYVTGVSLAKAKTFALCGTPEAIEIVKTRLETLGRVFKHLDSELPDDSDVDLSEMPEYKTSANTFLRCFDDFFASQISNEEYQTIKLNLVPRLS